MIKFSLFLSLYETKERHMRTTWKLIPLLVFSFTAHQPAVSAVIYESALLGTTGVSARDTLDQVIPARNILPNVFQGVRFNLPTPVRVERVGGHLIGFGLGGVAEGERGTIFGAIVALNSRTDLPDSPDLSTSDVLETTLIDLPEFSDDVYGELSLSLDAGWYALVFGGGLFGADFELGIGASLQNNVDIGDDPSYIGIQAPRMYGEWVVKSSSSANQRFVVEGSIIPEPSTLSLLFGVAFVVAYRIRHV